MMSRLQPEKLAETRGAKRVEPLSTRLRHFAGFNGDPATVGNLFQLQVYRYFPGVEGGWDKAREVELFSG